MKQLLLVTIHDMFVSRLNHRYVGYDNVITLQLLAHLYDNYANIIEADLIESQNTMNQPYDETSLSKSFLLKS